MMYHLFSLASKYFCQLIDHAAPFRAWSVQMLQCCRMKRHNTAELNTTWFICRSEMRKLGRKARLTAVTSCLEKVMCPVIVPNYRMKQCSNVLMCVVRLSLSIHISGCPTIRPLDALDLHILHSPDSSQVVQTAKRRLTTITNTLFRHGVNYTF